MFEHVLSALLALGANKLRAALTMLGVVIGVLAVTLLVSIGDGARSYLDRTLTSLGTNLLNVVPGRTETRGGFGPPPASGVARPLTMDDVRALERQATLLRGVSPIVMGGGTVRFRTRQRDTAVFGVGPRFSDLRNMHVDLGEFVRDEDLQARRRVVILGRRVVKELFGDENALGQPIRIAGGRYRVVGLMEEKGRSLGFDLDDLVFIPATTAMDQFGLTHLSQILTAARSKDDTASAVAEIEDVLARRRNGEHVFTVQSQDDLLKTFGALTTAMTLALLAIASVSLVVGGIGIMNIMLATVTERTREIGVRRALGATQNDIIEQFLTETVVLSGLGGLLGVGLGLLTPFAFDGLREIVMGVILDENASGNDTLKIFREMRPKVAFWSMPLAFGISVGIGVVFGIYPARNAARMDPIEALRHT